MVKELTHNHFLGRKENKVYKNKQGGGKMYIVKSRRY